MQGTNTSGADLRLAIMPDGSSPYGTKEY